MGMMSKNNRLPERPKPPSWEQTEEDISGAETDDVVFRVGKSSMPGPSTATTPVSSVDKSFNSSTASDSADQDVTSVDPEKVQASYTSVLKLISLYSELKDAPSQLQEQYSHLKQIGDEMTLSISELKALAQSINVDSTAKTESPADVSGSSKSKSKQKKKK